MTDRRVQRALLVLTVLMTTFIRVPGTEAVLPTPPAGPVLEGEALSGDKTVVSGLAASGGQFARTTTGISAPVPAGVSTGAYQLTVRIKAPSASRLDVTVDDEMVASYSVNGVWRTENAVVHIHDSATTVGVRAFAREGTPFPVEVDWIHFGAVPPQFTVHGTSALDPSGDSIVLRGANRHGYQRWKHGAQYNQPRPFHEGTAMSAWGMNAVRLALNEEFWLQDCDLGSGADGSTVHASPTKPDATPYTYREVIREEVRRYVDSGMFVVLDLHITQDGTLCPYEVPHDQKAMANRQRSIPFWQSVAGEFSDEPYVGFDLYNEPNITTEEWMTSDPDAVWRDGALMMARPPGVGSLNAAGMQELYAAVRGTGATNLIFVSGLEYALDVDVMMRRPLDGYGLVASPHVYCPFCPIPQDGHRRAILGEATGEPDLLGAAERFPTVVSETGSPAPDESIWNETGIDWFESHDLGWIVHNWFKGYGEYLGPDQETGNPWGILDEATWDDTSLDPVDRRTANANGQPIWDALAPLRSAGS